MRISSSRLLLSMKLLKSSAFCASFWRQEHLAFTAVLVEQSFGVIEKWHHYALLLRRKSVCLLKGVILWKERWQVCENGKWCQVCRGHWRRGTGIIFWFAQFIYIIFSHLFSNFQYNRRAKTQTRQKAVTLQHGAKHRKWSVVYFWSPAAVLSP